jgi:hypothetical protein
MSVHSLGRFNLLTPNPAVLRFLQTTRAMVVDSHVAFSLLPREHSLMDLEHQIIPAMPIASG